MEEKMGLIPMVQWNVNEILKKFQEIGSGLGKWLEIIIKWISLSLEPPSLETGVNIKEKHNTMDPSFQREIGFRYKMETNRKPTSKASSFFLPHRVLLNLSFSLFYLGPFSFMV